MKNQSYALSVKLLTVLTFAMSPLTAPLANAKTTIKCSGTSDCVSKCNEAGTAAENGSSGVSNLLNDQTGNSENQTGGNMAAAGTASNSIYDDAISHCDTLMGLCKGYAKKEKKGQDPATVCKDIQKEVDAIKAAKEGATQATTGGAATQSAASGNKGNNGSSSGGDLGSALPMLAMGAVAGLAVAQMMAQKAAQEAAAANALQANGAVDCSKLNAAGFTDCRDYLTTQCGTQLTSGSQTPACQAFTASYCAATQTPDSSTQKTLPNGAVIQINIAGTGEGQKTSYCTTALSAAYCAQGANPSCPACMQLTANQSQACVNNPASCLAQNSATQLAAMASSCPGDPVIAASMAGGSNYTAAAGAPAVVLPQSLSGSSSTGATASSGSSGGASATSTMSFSGAAQGANREGQTGYSGAVNGKYGGGAGAGGREVASSGGSAIHTSSVSSGPASDVQGQFGPSVFAMSSQVIRQHCEAGKINNCP